MNDTSEYFSPANGRSRPRIVLLGASNLTRSISTITGTVQHLLKQHINTTASEWFIAYGHGRSFGRWSSILTRSLPGINDCGLWDKLDNSISDDGSVEPGLQTPLYALLTDVGNDIPHGIEPDIVAEWVISCIDRLRTHGANIVMTGLPIAALDSSSPMICNFLRRLFFPGCSMSRLELLERARCVHSILRDFALSNEIPFIEMPLEWYHLDPIHIRRNCCASAWYSILNNWFQDEILKNVSIGQTSVHPSMRRWLYWRSRPYAQVSIAGNAVHSTGPAGYDRQSGNARIWLY